MKTSMSCTLTLLALSAACAADGSSNPTASSDKPDDVSVQVAFYGLTVVDCQQQATQCYKKAAKGLLRQPLSCASQLSMCVAKAGAEAAKGVLDETADVATCATEGNKCYRAAKKLSAVLACENTVEKCVLGNVKDLTGIPLPTSQETAGAVAEHAGAVAEHVAEHAEHAVETAVAVAETAHETAHAVAEQAVGTTIAVAKVGVEVAEHAAETAVRVGTTAVRTGVAVTEHAIETAHEVAHEVAETAVGVATDAVEAGLATAKSALQCGQQSQTCIRTSYKLLSCQLAYADCMSKAL